jgi:biotin-(acetyl-CoA carboxylase) ligase
VLDGYRARCVTRGQAVRVRGADGDWTEGVATEVGDDGALHVRLPDGTVRTMTDTEACETL